MTGITQSNMAVQSERSPCGMTWSGICFLTVWLGCSWHISVFWTWVSPIWAGKKVIPLPGEIRQELSLMLKWEPHVPTHHREAWCIWFSLTRLGCLGSSLGAKPGGGKYVKGMPRNSRGNYRHCLSGRKCSSNNGRGTNEKSSLPIVELKERIHGMRSTCSYESETLGLSFC